MEVLALVANGCEHIIINEPAFADYPEKAIEHGADDIIKIFSACPANVRKEIKLNLGKSVSPAVMRKCVTMDRIRISSFFKFSRKPLKMAQIVFYIPTHCVINGYIRPFSEASVKS